jgi:rod shape-determining protein MreC
VRNIFLIIRRYFNFLFFVVLQAVALYILFQYNKFHEAAFMGVANELTGRVSGKYDNITYYFHLKTTNEALVKENEELRNKLRANFADPDTTRQLVQDSIPFDTLGHTRRFLWRPAKVVNNSVIFQNNTLTIARGENQGVKKDMGVIGPQGVVGIVINTSGNYAVVMSLLHRQMHLSAKLKKTGEAGTVTWDGLDPSYITMSRVPRSIPVVKGDSIVTSAYLADFPEGIMVGTVSEVVEDKSSNFYTLRLKPATNFYNVEYVTVIENLQKDEQKKLEEASKKIANE